MPKCIYVCLYLARGKLPWMGLGGGSDKNKRNLRIVKKKAGVSLSELCRGAPPGYLHFISRVRGLKFSETPPYDELHAYLSR